MNRQAWRNRPEDGGGRWFVSGFVLVMLAALGWTWWHQPPRSEMARVKPGFVVDVNQADVTALASLPGLGRSTAQRIIDHRQAHGPFVTPQDLTRVRGIGPGRLAQMLPWITCGPALPMMETSDTLIPAEPAAQREGS